MLTTFIIICVVFCLIAMAAVRAALVRRPQDG